MGSRTLDYRKGLTVSDDHCFNELVTLQTLEAGLHELAVSVWCHEESLRREDEAENRQRFFGNVPGLHPHTRSLLACFFHWYGVTLCNYARLVGFVGAIEAGVISKDLLQSYDKKAFLRVKAASDAYVKSVAEIKDVVTWRNKVAAHFAMTAPREDDNPMTLEASVVYPVSYDAGRFRVGTWVLGQVYQDGTKYGSEIPMWSLTEIHEDISGRYWPEFQFPSHLAS
jgi:hypothetical protein